jgi:hypothetical protein
MENEQHYFVKFFCNKVIPGIEIVARLRPHYGEGALPRTEVYFWINELKLGRTDINTTTSPERDPGEDFTAVIAGKIDANPRLSARKLAQSLGIAASTVCRYSTEVLGLKFQHLCWVPHMLTVAQK